ncbi:OmpA family protein [Pseudomarimonas arenosa]|uniref:OmpA family protein n=1 Tax=Pseudomarimonas arenosa TaxID=2774145 RepID=A0AAW3ZKT0_9GAMM|nr:OmpA family protein [Pseudomarimonas arenosa]MBD8524916.1 OmpA family protein [Pseudomarimonas arenosa]
MIHLSARLAAALIFAMGLAGCASTPQKDLAVERLEASLSALNADAALANYAAAERLQARQALAALRQADKKSRPDRLYIAERRLDIARITAQAEMAADQLEQLERERDRIMLEATRRDAERNRLEAEKLRLQSLARAEEAARAQEEAEAARLASELSSAEAEAAKRLAEAQAAEANLAKREAELALAAADSLRIQLESITSKRDARGEVMTLSGDAFASGQSNLRPEARGNLGRIVEFLQSKPGAVIIEGHTDNRGSANLNQVLSQKRADAVRQALIEEGVDGSRMTAVGRGMDQPVADNGSADGRARNRRVEIVLSGG